MLHLRLKEKPLPSPTLSPQVALCYLGGWQLSPESHDWPALWCQRVLWQGKRPCGVGGKLPWDSRSETPSLSSKVTSTAAENYSSTIETKQASTGHQVTMQLELPILSCVWSGWKAWPAQCQSLVPRRWCLRDLTGQEQKVQASCAPYPAPYCCPSVPPSAHTHGYWDSCLIS